MKEDANFDYWIDFNEEKIRDLFGFDFTVEEIMIEIKKRILKIKENESK